MEKIKYITLEQAWKTIDFLLQSPYTTKALLFFILFFLVLIFVVTLYMFRKLFLELLEIKFFGRAMDKGFRDVIANGKGDDYETARDEEEQRLWDSHNRKKVKFIPKLKE